MTATMSRVDELNAALQVQLAEMKTGLDAMTIEVSGANTYVKGADAEKIRQARQNAEEIKALIEAEMFGEEMKSWGKTPAAASVAMTAAAMGASFQEAKTLAEMFTESEEFKSFRQRGGLTMQDAWTLEGKDLGRLGTKDVYAGSGDHTITHGFGRIQFDPMVPRGQRATRVRDLFPATGTTANLIDFFRVTGFTENGGDGAASVVPDYVGGNFGSKPHSNLAFTPDQAPVRTIAHWEAAHRNILQDEPQLQSTINNELLYGLALEEDFQILRGSGTGEDLYGILTRNDTQTYTPASATELYSDSLRKAATKAIVANYAPRDYVVNPFDWERVELQKGQAGSGGDGQYMLFTNVSIGMSAQIWRQPVVETAAMPQGTFLTGAFGIGAQLYDRQVANIRIAEQHADFFVRNAVVILCEERLALATKRPESFVVGTFGA